MAIPQLSAEERQAALEKAKAARFKRAQVRDDLKNGKLSLQDVLAMKDDPIVGRMKVSTLIETLPGFGKAKAEKLMGELTFAESRRLKGRGVRQEAALRERLAFVDLMKVCGMQRKGNLFVLSGPSGAGKGTLVKRVLERVPDAWLSVSDTTRSPREGEIDGVHYFFVDDAEFDQLVETGGFLEWARVHENRYGTPRARVEEHMAKGGQVLLEIDVQGGFQIREQIPEAQLVFIEPPSLEVLESRLRGRGTDSEESIAVRMKNAQVELSHKMEYDKQFVNDDLEACTDELVAYIESQAKMCEE